MSAPEAVAVLMGVAALVLVLLLVWVAPPVLLRIVVRAYPRAHPRRAELLRELDDVAPGERLRWVASLALPCAREGAAARHTKQHGEPLRQRTATDRSPVTILFASTAVSIVSSLVAVGAAALVVPAFLDNFFAVPGITVVFTFVGAGVANAVLRRGGRLRRGDE